MWPLEALLELKFHQNVFAVGAPPQTLLGELRMLPSDSLVGSDRTHPHHSPPSLVMQLSATLTVQQAATLLLSVRQHLLYAYNCTVHARHYYYSDVYHSTHCIQMKNMLWRCVPICHVHVLCQVPVKCIGYGPWNLCAFGERIISWTGNV